MRLDQIIKVPVNAVRYLLGVLFLLSIPGFAANAQSLDRGNEEQTIGITLNINDNTSKAMHSYKLIGANYSVSKSSGMQEDGSCTLILELAQEADEFLLRWIAGNIKDIKGEVTIVDVTGVKKARKITFTDLNVASASESFYSAAGAVSWPQISVYIKSLTVDGTNIFPVAR